MSKRSSLSTLLLSDGEPTFALYDDVIESVTENPEQISALLSDNIRDRILIYITTRGDRLIHIFYLLHFRRLTTGRIAAQIISLLLSLVPSLYELVDEATLLKLIVYALCAVLPCYPPTLGNLVTVIADCGNLIERLTSDRSCSEVIRDWARSSRSTIRDAATLEMWTRRVVEMTSSCTSDHGVGEEIQRWSALMSLKSSLLELEHMHAQQTSKSQYQSSNSNLPLLAGMTQLAKDDKKTHRGRQQNPNDRLPDLKDDVVELLGTFDLPVPVSCRMLRNTIERLETEETVAILCAAVATFPCRLCNEAARHVSRPTGAANSATRDEDAEAAQKPGLDVLGKRMGNWKVLLSKQALKSIQDLNHSGAFSPVKAKLIDLASGCWDWNLAGSEPQRKRMKLPLAWTKCGQKLSILWQVDVGFDEETEAEQQVVKVWEIGTSSEISQAIDRVVVLQKYYSANLIRRCRKRPLTVAEKLIPTRFPGPPDSTAPALREPKPDIRAVDKDIIEMSNKFYALTEPVIRSVLANDMTAEFPYDLSEDEARVIRHFKTASLILGRSGTGKTTCLVFSLVGKYVARKAVTGERPVRQVLLTRSSFLSDKLRAYTKKLIETLTSKSLNLEQLPEDEDPFLDTGGDDLAGDTVFTLSDESFPLICTFDQFLRILENTVRVMDRKDFSNPTVAERCYISTGSSRRGTRTMRHRKPQLVDFHAFQLDYWPKFPGRLTKGLPIELVFAEIMGVIKGSASSRTSLAPLRREEYFTRSCRLAPAFAQASDRASVYEIFEMYEALKVGWGDVDYVDRVVRVLGAVRGDSMLRRHMGSVFDEVYFDEVQDQRCLDIELLLSIIKDGRGFHLGEPLHSSYLFPQAHFHPSAGDTAQSISQDSTFRFPDIKALFYEHFAAASASANQAQLARPTLFTLSKNYRSHQGILALASLVMDMLWNETVDKLEPEVGQLCGPKPILFVGCDSQVLVTKNVGLVKLSERIADFGAEQVILVRDEDAKTRLQAEIGDVALVLTILQSKGMEFDDVILWDFFTGCRCPASVRCLGALVKGAAGDFDAKKHAALCSDLKHLYVAITRARIQLSIIESSESAVAPVVKLLTQDLPEPLVEVTGPHHPNVSIFADKLKALRPGTSIDRRRWSLRGEQLMRQRNFNDALMCFRKARDHRGERIAQAHILEGEGRRCDAVDDVEGFTHNLQTAVDLFLEAKLVGDAVRNLERMGKFSEAAELWAQQEKYSKAAPLFAKAGLFDRAATFYDLSEKYDEAAAALRQGNHFDQLVSYLSSNRERIDPTCYRSHSRLCNLLLRQGRIPPAYRELAVKTLGSHAEQEAFFIEHEMHEQLAESYADRGMYNDLFYLLVRMGEMERALSALTGDGSLRSIPKIPEDHVWKVLDYAWAGRLIRPSEQPPGATAKLTTQGNCFLTPRQLKRYEQWDVGYQLIHHLQGTETYKQLRDTEDTPIKKFLHLYVITLAPMRITQPPSLAELPFEIVKEAISTVKDLFVQAESDAWSAVLLLTGVFNMDGKTYVLLPWSPLRENSTDIIAGDYPQLAKTWLLDKMASAILELDKKARELRKTEWPVRCVQFLRKGYCPKAQQGECMKFHKPPHASDCSQMIKDLLRVNLVFCDLTGLYYHRVMTEQFQERFLGTRRYWLEQLLRELTYISSFEQDTSVLMKAQTELFCGNQFVVIASRLEELLFFRLRSVEWLTLVGRCVERRFFRALSHKIYSLTDGGSMKQQLQTVWVLSCLEGDISIQNAPIFKSNLEAFLTGLDCTEIRYLTSVHAVTAVFEFFTLYLIFLTCPRAFVVPQSWADMHLPWVAAHPSATLSESKRYIYQECLIQLVVGFCRILSRLDKAFNNDPDFSFCFGGRGYPRWILQQRNAELLAIAIINLGSTNILVHGFRDAWMRATEAFEYRNVRADYLRHNTLEELCTKLTHSFAVYGDKNSLIVITRTGQPHVFSGFLKKLGVETISMDFFYSLRPTEPLAGHPATSASNTDQYSTREIEAVTTIQRFWRSRFPKLRDTRTFKQTPEAQAAAIFIALGAQKCVTVATRAILVSQGVNLHLKLATAQNTLCELQKQTITCVNDARVPIDRFDLLDDVLERLRHVDGMLRDAAERMSREHLAGQIERGSLAELRKVFRDIESVVEKAEDEMRRGREVVGSVSEGCFQT
ncbi:hypothetical protein AOQ84DRAFT_221144 [Glonium stellatum]|uniref:UvrD-like helicase ATP-binding domain-containing protein n=1 Tax=Glonium stellatum TaxID=574774 RepID=A0A8E2JTK3_9PEZI|nr:hypothetical protein AOQ84DRAFT_221144 [Glonium stellatum]